jgi:hypothetical protein
MSAPDHAPPLRDTYHVWRDVLALAFLALLTLLFFWPVFLFGYWIPRGGGDLVSFLWPQYSFAAEAIQHGTIPLWNPQLYAGAPFLADNQAGVLYPINLLVFFVFPRLTYQVMEGLSIFHVWLAGAAMYVGLRLWPPFNPPRSTGEMTRRAALLGAIAFMFNDVVITHIGNLNLIAVAAWLPLVLALYARGLSDRRVSWIVGSGVVFAVALLAGHAQMTAITLVGMMAVAVWQIILQVDTLRQSHRVNSMADNESRLKADSSARAVVKVMGLALLAPLIVFGLTAMQLLPSLEMTRYSLRAGLSYEEATAYSLPPAALASTFSPLLFGRGAAEFWGPWERVETMFVGVVPLLLAGLAFRRKWRDASWFFLALGVLGVIIALGKFTPFYSIIHALPILGGLRVPARFILLANFSLAALAAIGLQRLRDDEVSVGQVMKWGLLVLGGGSIVLLAAYGATCTAGCHKQDALLMAVCVFVGIGALALLAMWRRIEAHAPRTIGFLIGLTAFELIALGAWVEVDWHDPTLGFQHQGVVDFLQNDGGVFRIENASRAWQPDAALLHGLNDIGGIFNPLGLANYETYRGGMGNRGSPLYNFLGAKYVLANKDQPPGDASFVPVFNGDSQIDVYLNTGALPRAQLIDRAVAVRSGEEAWQAIHAAEFDPRREVVIEGGIDLHPPANIDAARKLTFLNDSRDRVELSVLTPITTYLVMSDVFYPGWTAAIDDEPTQVYPANFAFRAVLVPPGEHRVALTFEPTTWRAGVIISAVTLVGLLGFGVWRWRRNALHRMSGHISGK